MADAYRDLAKRFLEGDRLDEAVGDLGLPPDAARAWREAGRRILGDVPLATAFGFLVTAMAIAHQPWDMAFHDCPLPPALGPDAAVFPSLLLVATWREGLEAGRRRGIPPEALGQSGANLREAILAYQGKSGRWGAADLFHWHYLNVGSTMFRLGRVKFGPWRMDGRFSAWRGAGGETAILCGDGLAVRADGLFAFGDEPVAFRTTCRAGVDEYHGHPVSRDHRISSAAISLERPAWRPLLEAGDIWLDLHIPSGEGYAPEEVGASLRMAAEFYGRHFPELRIGGFRCHSWLFSPQLREMLPEGGRILQMQRLFWNCPMPSDFRPFVPFVLQQGSFDPATAPRDTSLRRAFVERVEAGLPLSIGVALYFREDLAAWGKEPGSGS